MEDRKRITVLGEGFDRKSYLLGLLIGAVTGILVTVPTIVYLSTGDSELVLAIPVIAAVLMRMIVDITARRGKRNKLG